MSESDASNKVRICTEYDEYERFCESADTKVLNQHRNTLSLVIVINKSQYCTPLVLCHYNMSACVSAEEKSEIIVR